MNIVARTAADYLSLITSAHVHKPKFEATVALACEGATALQAVYAKMLADFDVDTATGAQLDIIGIWVGQPRQLPVPIDNVYFSFNDVVATGWQAGVWKDRYESTTSLTTLPDPEYRQLIRAKIVANTWDGSIPGAYAAWQVAFPDAFIMIQDNQDMSMEMTVVSLSLSSLMKAIITSGLLPLKPEGVRVTYVFSDALIFAWDNETPPYAGWDSGNWL